MNGPIGYPKQKLEFPGYWGDWGIKEFCQNDGYATGFATQVEGTDDDETAMNGLYLDCSGGDYITSARGGWGSWNYAQLSNSCVSGYTGAKVRVEGPQVIYTLYAYIYISLVIFISEIRTVFPRIVSVETILF